MATSELEKVRGWLYEGVQKFDYFLTGISAAVLAYSVQAYAPAASEVGRFLVPLGWVLLGSSFYSGLKSQEWLLKVVAVAADVAWHHERFDELIAAERKYRAEGKIDEASQASRDWEDNERVLARLYQQRESFPKRVMTWDKLRGWCFLLGMAALGTWRLINF